MKTSRQSVCRGVHHQVALDKWRNLRNGKKLEMLNREVEKPHPPCGGEMSPTHRYPEDTEKSLR
ncbi:MAG: hypothetical protein VKL59_08425 [Nostocaceae cyanobacterium]|nr:hypothetical protein [Nostocaceae cyanobacterium]